MMLGTRLHITPYARQHLSALLDLSWYSQWTHKHLDWFTASQWLDLNQGDILLAWQGDELVGYMGVSRPIQGWSWVRLLGIRDGRLPGQTVRELWERTEAHCRSLDVENVAILMVTNWLPSYFAQLGFSYADDIITLSHAGRSLPPEQQGYTKIRAADEGDVPQMARIDQRAFPPPWQISADEMWQALRLVTQATVATVAEQVVAYQLSTRHQEISHLARLVVDPAFQRRGIASALLRGALAQAREMRVETITVNTQLSNLPSQHLYQQNGFFRNGHDIELWRKHLL